MGPDAGGSCSQLSGVNSILGRLDILGIITCNNAMLSGKTSAEVALSAEENPFLFPLDLLGDPSQPSNIASGNGFSLSDSPSDSAAADIAPIALADGSDRLDHANLPGQRGKAGWWLLHTKPRQEKKLGEELAKLEIPHYLPVVKHKAITRGRTRITRSPLFSGYFFLCGTSDQRLRALETNRLVATHRVDDSEGLCARLQELAKLIELGAPLTAEARLAVGRKVRVKSGSFQNMEGVIIKRGGKTRLFVMVNELLGGVSLAIEEHLLEPIY